MPLIKPHRVASRYFLNFKQMKKTVFLSLMSFMTTLPALAGIVTYPAPAEAPLNDMFSVEVSGEDGKWHDVAVYNVKVDEVTGTGHNVKNSSMAYFDFDGIANVRIISSVQISSAQVRPVSYGIKPDVKNDTLLFTLGSPRNLSVEVNGDRFNNLQLFANAIDKTAPENIKKFTKNKKNLYFGPGYHKFDMLNLESGSEVYVAGGAFIDGQIEINDAENVKLHGRGMIYPRNKMGIHVKRSRNVEIEGLFTTQCAVGGCDSVKIENVKVMSYYGWGDGFNVFASNNVHYNNVFARTSDDCTTVYATRKGFKGGCRNIVTENSVLWADVAHPFMIGLHGSAKEIGVDAPADTIENVVYRNIDILDMQEKQIDYQGVFAITAGDNNVVRDITFDNIRVEDFRQGKLVDIRIVFNKKYCAAPGTVIENVNFNDITYNGDNSELSLIIGYDDNRKVKGIHFNNLTINGKKYWDEMPDKPKWYKTGDMCRIFIGEHVEDVTFTVTDPTDK